jgi:exonuclease SbcC
LSNDWKATGRKRLKEVEKTLESNKYAADEQKQLARLDKELARLGYDASAHDEARAKESELRGVEEEFGNLKSAKEVSKQIESEIKNLQSEISNRRSEINEQETEYAKAASILEDAESQAPSLDEAEREMFRLREEENKVRSELGGAQQRVDILTTQRTRKADFEKEREQLQRLERAFGKDGVPALLIEQALPHIESKANDLLERLSGGQMSIRFVTQAEYKDKKRDDLKETLDIQISDTAGTRAYEMYSGGEAFRVNFAIRLALSETLAQRKGARLQTLVIDEGFGSQDALGRQRLIEAINLVRHDFAKILIITHLDELKDAFPTRIEVEKADGSSTIKVI